MQNFRPIGAETAELNSFFEIPIAPHRNAMRARYKDRSEKSMNGVSTNNWLTSQLVLMSGGYVCNVIEWYMCVCEYPVPGLVRFQLEQISAVTDPGPECFRLDCTNIMCHTHPPLSC